MSNDEKGVYLRPSCLFTIDSATGLCRRAERVDLTDENSAQR